MFNNKVDIKENYIRDLDKELLYLLLVDKTSKKNIIWATDDYEARGKGFKAQDQIMFDKITGRYGNVIKPRIEKSKFEIQTRIKNKAEVFTPSWVCNAQNNLVDESWFGYKPVFNTVKENKWIVKSKKIKFINSKTWQDYVKENRLEITCGEAPYLVSRYDTVTGEIISTKRRIGLLDRKLRIINENVASDDEWLKWVEYAIKSIYGYDWQGDNVLLARENILFTFIDYYIERFSKMPENDLLIKIADIIVWNIWQMDGLKGVIPNSCKGIKDLLCQKTKSKIKNKSSEKSCLGCIKNDIYYHNGKYCKIKDWEKNKTIKFISLIKEY